jgi:F-type H+-transporting ATPase subunit epsilon
VPQFRCDILTPYRRLYTGEVESLHFVTFDGEVEILASHEPIVAPVAPCVLRLDMAEGGRKLAAAGEGFVTIKANHVEVFLDVAEWPAEIDRKRAEEALARAEKRLSEGAMTWEVARAKASATRARVRLAALVASAAAAEAARQ